MPDISLRLVNPKTNSDVCLAENDEIARRIALDFNSIFQWLRVYGLGPDITFYQYVRKHLDGEDKTVIGHRKYSIPIELAYAVLGLSGIVDVSKYGLVEIWE